MKESYQTYDSFVGKISPFLLFEMEFHSLFYVVHLITPFNKEEISRFNSIVYKRNLLVHHAGYYTLQSLKKDTLLTEEIRQKAFKDAV